MKLLDSILEILDYRLSYNLYVHLTKKVEEINLPRQDFLHIFFDDIDKIILK